MAMLPPSTKIPVVYPGDRLTPDNFNILREEILEIKSDVAMILKLLEERRVAETNAISDLELDD